MSLTWFLLMTESVIVTLPEVVSMPPPWTSPGSW